MEAQMKVVGFTVQLSSGQPEVLRDFYRDVVGLDNDEVVGGFKVGDGHLLIDSTATSMDRTLTQRAS